MNHPQVAVTYGDTTAEIDEEIADLILTCWNLHIPTRMSCQRSEWLDGTSAFPVQTAWIEFRSRSGLLHFLDPLGDLPDRSEGWAYFLEQMGNHRVWFPYSDVPEIVRCLSTAKHVHSEMNH